MIKAKIDNFLYNPTFSQSELKIINWNNFNINESKSSFLLNLSKNKFYGVSKWISPKRTRSEPFARIYDTYYISKRITVIPIIKDEGKNGELDRINSLTMSWMNLTNVFIILAWYSSANKKNDFKIKNQSFDHNWVKNKIQEISNYQFDAHHWNNNHFKNDFEFVYKKAVLSYKKIEQKLMVKMHSRKNDIKKLNLFKEGDNFSLKKFVFDGLKMSKHAANREIKTNHKMEIVSKKTFKEVLHIENFLGGEYFLTVDEMFIRNDILILRESKNSKNSFLPSFGEIKDALFKIMLFKNIKIIKIEKKTIKHNCEIILYGNNKLSLDLPTSNKKISFLNVKENIKQIIRNLNKESSNNNIRILLRSNNLKGESND